ncbi:MAG TPA: thioesterase family protein [Acidobacteriota bacterium]|jgi:acyl-CoA thioester hydrolase|nr:thioesterase family protein [Acidobacteriota bacterium]HNT17812.1 thioesterase family protein [Acidobacteriota bacterium]HPA27498.1 thioesterase family protein [Acidobacteriota bacterium]HQO20677.1 thioesterase family protein [Acidobacteriota bacterium]HQQ47848.1 thioesterase family protein [Acidobacteriota bacterium]
MKGYKVVTKIQLRFRDLDAIGHVNAPVYFSYLELGRLEMFNRMAGKKMKLQEIDFIVGRLEGDYLAPVVLGDELTLGTRLVSLGRTSCVVEQLLEANGKPAFKAREVLVFIDREKKSKKPVPGYVLDGAAEFMTKED